MTEVGAGGGGFAVLHAASLLKSPRPSGFAACTLQIHHNARFSTLFPTAGHIVAFATPQQPSLAFFTLRRIPAHSQPHKSYAAECGPRLTRDPQVSHVCAYVYLYSTKKCVGTVSKLPARQTKARLNL